MVHSGGLLQKSKRVSTIFQYLHFLFELVNEPIASIHYRFNYSIVYKEDNVLWLKRVQKACDLIPEKLIRWRHQLEVWYLFSFGCQKEMDV